MCVPAAAQDSAPEVFTSGDYEYILLEDGTAEIHNYWGKETDFMILDTLDGYTVTSIGTGSFLSRKYPAVITLPDSVTSIGDWSFRNCVNLTSIVIPENVVSIGVNPFVDCGLLTDIQISPEHPVFGTIDGVLFSKDEKRLICYPKAFSAESYSIPEEIRIIGDWAFYHCSSLKSITIPDNVTTIGDNAFCICEGLERVEISDGVSSIGECAFQFCENLVSVSIPASVTSIGTDAFFGCSNLTVTVEKDSYAEKYCKACGIPYSV